MNCMCGRFAVTTDPAVLAEKINAINEARAAESTGPNYNVAPTTHHRIRWRQRDKEFMLHVANRSVIAAVCRLVFSCSRRPAERTGCAGGCGYYMCVYK